MSPQSLPTSLGSTLTRAGLAACCGGAGSLAALTLGHDRASGSAIAAGAVTAAVAVNAAASAFKSLADAIEAVGNLLAALIRARADAKATIINARVRADLARAGLDPAKTSQAAEMQRLLSVNPDLPKDRRVADETLIKLHGASRARNSGESGTSPDSPGNSPRMRRPPPARSFPSARIPDRL
jgi:hypothetical protein